MIVMFFGPSSVTPLSDEWKDAASLRIRFDQLTEKRNATQHFLPRDCNRLVNWTIIGIGGGLEQWQDQCLAFGLADPSNGASEYVAASFSATGQLCRFNICGGSGYRPRCSD
jgi:hypothetical protein